MVSPRSQLTENKFEVSAVHRAPGIDDSQNAIYKEYDKSGRQFAAMSNKASHSALDRLS